MARTATDDRESARISIPRRRICAGPRRRISPTAKSITSSKTACGSRGCQRWGIRTADRMTTPPGNWFCSSAPLAATTPQEKAEQIATAASAHYVGSAACQKCHAEIYERWKKTPMANVVRDPREHPDAIIPESRHQQRQPEIHEGSGRVRVREHLEAALFHENRRRLFSRARAVGRDQQDVAAVFCGQRHGLVGDVLSSRQHEAAHRPHLRRLPFGGLQHSDQAGGGVERGLRALPRSRAASMWSMPRAATF